MRLQSFQFVNQSDKTTFTHNNPNLNTRLEEYARGDIYEE